MRDPLGLFRLRRPAAPLRSSDPYETEVSILTPDQPTASETTEPWRHHCEHMPEHAEVRGGDPSDPDDWNRWGLCPWKVRGLWIAVDFCPFCGVQLSKADPNGGAIVSGTVAIFNDRGANRRFVQVEVPVGDQNDTVTMRILRVVK